jgi:hypothetical protein
MTTQVVETCWTSWMFARSVCSALLPPPPTECNLPRGAAGILAEAIPLVLAMGGAAGGTELDFNEDLVVRIGLDPKAAGHCERVNTTL